MVDVVEEWFVELDKLKEKPEIEFLGIAVDILYPCECRYCRKGKEALEEAGQTADRRQLHIVIAPLNNFTKLQHAYITMSSKAKVSRKGVWVHAMTINRIPFKNRKEFEKFLKNNVILYKKTTVGEYCIERMGLSETVVNQFGRVRDAQVLYPEKVIPMDALELYDLTKEEVEFRKKIYKEAWKRILDGEDENEVYEWVTEQLAQELEEMFEEEETEEVEEEEEEKEEKKSKKSKKAKKSKKKKEEEETEEEEEEEEEEIEV